MNACGFKEEELQGANMPVIFGLSYVFSVLIAFILTTIVIHQGGVFSMLNPEVMVSGSDEMTLFNDLMAKYGDRSRTFGHGAIHGGLFTVFFVFPLVAINALFERRGWKYIFIHTGYWLINLILMGGLLCAVLNYAPLT